MAFNDDMRIVDEDGKRLYLSTNERERFLQSSKTIKKINHRLFCEVLHWTGCRLSEASELTPKRIKFESKTIQIRTLKRRLKDKKGNDKKPDFREVPVPVELLERLDIAFNLRHTQSSRLDHFLWPNARDHKKQMSRTTAWNIVKRVMDDAKILGPQASPKGLRHGFGVAMTLAGMDVFQLRDLLGHASAETTQIYRQVVGEDAHKLQMNYWQKAK